MSRQRITARGLGQNFLVDRAAIRRIVEALAAGPGDAVVEIGPGRGALTEGLIAGAGRIVAIEYDRRLAEALRRRFAETRLIVVARDVLRVELASLGPLLGRPAGAPLAVAGNLPYAISKPVAMKLIRERRSVARAILMFQKEVADRLLADPGTRSYGPLTVLARLTYTVERLFDLGPGAFRPRPKVDSTVTTWRPLEATLDERTERALVSVLAAAFRSRRRTLRNNLLAALDDGARVDRLLGASGLDSTVRAEAIPPDGFLGLAHGWPPSL
ncbi:MAG TPA: 16S rRNA (adenine(1518)-N(6)/adenine(1519)-N(6))-dimethyltransferase RsmA [Candidatus Polarisedimenticolaceae bacterium]|nr:16S rRNA (adenine(1518)-N(6)/adenine(1519)-N(6))-dimethyltransferase RsmA [Candidatus Polarisedimenticolaceae bacterium]